MLPWSAAFTTGIQTIETVQETQHSSFLRKRLCKKPNTRRSCERDCARNPIFVVPAKETVQETLARLRWRKTQPPKSPLSGGLVTQFPPDKGGKGG